ncbi:PEP-utilizing enzyme [Diaminobutyricimonas sp. TR449]|uniref:PEP-utilizing enzyme n=1 Tax=Diaminobutyricimonas sp. TR449 TaxID=2708076 RepID=UPI0014242828|nr:PEP-utilizing enzyme [Diaminobutyricimonas sp. TR449]
MSTSDRFPFIREFQPPAGAEGWERMYPYFLTSQPEGEQLEDERLWFADTMHWSRAVYPLDSIGAEAVYLGAGQNSARIFALPTSLGLDMRVVNGYVYISPTGITDPDVINERLVHFQERAGYYFANWEELYEQWKNKMTSVVEAMRGIDFPALAEYEPIEVVTEARGRSTAWDLIASYHKLIDDFFVAWQYHFEFLNLGYGGYITFFQTCKQFFPEISDQSVARMVAGVDVLAFRPDDELRGLARKAVELGVDSIVSSGDDPAAIVASLRDSENGRAWIDALETAKDPWFNYFAEYGFLHDQDTWLSNPSIPFAGIARYIEMLQGGEEIARDVAKLRTERDAIVAEYRGLLAEDEAAQFDGMLQLARTVFPFIEEHNIYVEHWTHSVFFQKLRELSARLVEVGFFADAEDMYLLNRIELDEVLADVVQSHVIGVPARGVQKWRAEVAERKGMMTALRSQAAAPALGTPPAEITDPFAIMNYGVTTERIRDWLGQSSGEGALTGAAASPGVVEGMARVILTEKDLPQLQPGEILVAPITAPSWGAAFSVASAVVTDIGGMMCHAAIVCREYGLSAVVGTGFATSRIKTGQRIRVNGDDGTVTIIGEAEEAA